MKQYIIRHSVFFVILLIVSSLSAQNQLSGVVNYHENENNPLPEVTLELYDMGDNLIATTVSNNIGEFLFLNIPYGEYYLRSTATLPIGEINLIDANLVLQNINGTYPFNDYEFEAGDVNGSNNITYGDYRLIMNRILNRGKPWQSDEWQFEEAYVDFTARGDSTVEEVWGTSTGDVEGIWMPGGRSLDIFEGNQPATTVSNEEIELQIGSSYSDFINGYNLNLTYPKNLIEVTDIIGPDENFQFNLDENTGILNVIWLDESIKPGNKVTGEILFTVKVKQIRNSVQIENGVFSLLEGGMVLDSKSKQIGDITIELPKITTTTNNFEFELISYPNPVTSNLNIEITNPADNNANIHIYDMVGRLVHEISNTSIYKGTQVINVNTEGLPSGHYIYKVQMQGTNNFSGRFYKAN